MRKLLAAAFLLSSTLALPASAQTADIRFLPPNPTSQTPVTVRLSGEWPSTDVPRGGRVSVTGQTISIFPDCTSGIGGAAITAWKLDVWIGLLQAGTYNVSVMVPDICPQGVSTPARLAAARLVVQEARPAFDVIPNVRMTGSGAYAGVVISGALRPCGDTAICTAPVVRFGENVGTVIAFDTVANRIQVLEPMGSGTVDVSVQFAAETVRRVAAFHYATESFSPPPEFYMPVLFPVFFSARGAFGSEWDTEASVRNENDYYFSTPRGSPLDLLPCTCDPPPPVSTPGHTTRVMKASQSRVALPNGSLTYVSRQAAPKLDFGLLVRDRSRQSEALGAEVPVVREHELYDESFSLLNIPDDDRFRSALRIYSIGKPGVVRIRIRTVVTDAPIVDVQLGLPVSGLAEHQYGSVAIGDLSAAYPQIRGRGPLRIEISPATPGDLRLWAFVAVTNNETQHVTVISPQ